MAGGKNLATKYANKADERFSKESQAMLAVNSDFEFTGANTVKVYSIPVVAMSDYQRNGSNRYGTPSDLTRNVQSLTVTKDRAFSFIIDKGDKVQSEMVSDAGKALARQIRVVWVPEFDTYVFRVLADAATESGNTDATTATTSNAYSLFLNAMEKLGNQNVPDKGRVCFCSCKFANLLKQDSAFMRYGDAAQQMLFPRALPSRLPWMRIVAHASRATIPPRISCTPRCVRSSASMSPRPAAMWVPIAFASTSRISPRLRPSS